MRGLVTPETQGSRPWGMAFVAGQGGVSFLARVPGSGEQFVAVHRASGTSRSDNARQYRSPTPTSAQPIHTARNLKASTTPQAGIAQTPQNPRNYSTRGAASS